MSAPEKPVDFGSLIRGFAESSKTPEQQTCPHILSTKMPDGKFFCPSCRLISEQPLVQP